MFPLSYYNILSLLFYAAFVRPFRCAAFSSVIYFLSSSITVTFSSLQSVCACKSFWPFFRDSCSSFSVISGSLSPFNFSFFGFRSVIIHLISSFHLLFCLIDLFSYDFIFSSIVSPTSVSFLMIFSYGSFIFCPLSFAAIVPKDSFKCVSNNFEQTSKQTKYRMCSNANTKVYFKSKEKLVAPDEGDALLVMTRDS